MVWKINQQTEKIKLPLIFGALKFQLLFLAQEFLAHEFIKLIIFSLPLSLSLFYFQYINNH